MLINPISHLPKYSSKVISHFNTSLIQSVPPKTLLSSLQLQNSSVVKSRLCSLAILLNRYKLTQNGTDLSV